MDQEIINKLVKAGKVAAEVRREGAIKLSKPGASFREVMDYCEERVIKLGGELAWAQMALNDVAAHYCPEQEDDSQAVGLLHKTQSPTNLRMATGEKREI